MQEQIRIRTQDGQYLIIGGDFQSMLAVVRQMPGRRFRGDEKVWELPCRVEEVQKAVEAAGFHVTADTEMGKPLRAGPRPAGQGRPGGNRVVVRCPDGERAVIGADFDATKEAIKALPGRRWVAEEKVWAVPVALAELEKALSPQGLQLVAVDAPEATPSSAPSSSAGPAAPPSRPAQRQDVAGGRRRDQVRIRTLDGDYWVVGGTFTQMLDAIKRVEGRRFSSADKLWDLPCSAAEAGTALASSGLQMEPMQGAAPQMPPPENEEDDLF